MAELIMTIGLPASGKTEWAKQQEGFEVVSSDDIRAELGDVNDQSNNTEVFRILHQRIRDHLSSGQSCVYDATNLNCKKRRAFLNNISDLQCKKTAVVFITPPEVLRARNESRERKAPGHVFSKMIRQFQPPIREEGWDEILQIKYDGDYDDPIVDLCDMDQDNPHHSLTFLEHAEAVEKHVEDRHSDRHDLITAAYNHDVGKYWTKTFTDSKGYPSPVAHYYGHEGYGAYMYLLNPGRDEDLRVAALIAHHMRPYVWDTNKDCEEKDRAWMGSFADDLAIIHEADKECH